MAITPQAAVNVAADALFHAGLISQDQRDNYMNMAPDEALKVLQKDQQALTAAAQTIDTKAKVSTLFEALSEISQGRASMGVELAAYQLMTAKADQQARQAEADASTLGVTKDLISAGIEINFKSLDEARKSGKLSEFYKAHPEYTSKQTGAVQQIINAETQLEEAAGRAQANIETAIAGAKSADAKAQQDTLLANAFLDAYNVGFDFGKGQHTLEEALEIYNKESAEERKARFEKLGVIPGLNLDNVDWHNLNVGSSTALYQAFEKRGDVYGKNVDLSAVREKYGITDAKSMYEVMSNNKIHIPSAIIQLLTKEQQDLGHNLSEQAQGKNAEEFYAEQARKMHLDADSQAMNNAVTAAFLPGNIALGKAFSAAQTGAGVAEDDRWMRMTNAFGGGAFGVRPTGVITPQVSPQGDGGGNPAETPRVTHTALASGDPAKPPAKDAAAPRVDADPEAPVIEHASLVTGGRRAGAKLKVIASADAPPPGNDKDKGSAPHFDPRMAAGPSTV